MPEKTTRILVLLTFVGVMGLYVAAWFAYQKYQALTAQYQSSGGGLAGLLSLAKS